MFRGHPAEALDPYAEYTHTYLLEVMINSAQTRVASGAGSALAIVIAAPVQTG
jgi:hypothetical protein